MLPNRVAQHHAVAAILHIACLEGAAQRGFDAERCEEVWTDARRGNGQVAILQQQVSRSPGKWSQPLGTLRLAPNRCQIKQGVGASAAELSVDSLAIEVDENRARRLG